MFNTDPPKIPNIWPWSKFRKLENKIARELDLRDALLWYINENVDGLHTVFNNRMYIWKKDQTWVMEKTT